MTARLSSRSILETIQAHPAGLQYVDGLDAYTNQSDFIEVRHLACGLTSSVTVAALRSEKFAGCGVCFTNRLAQAVCFLSLSYLLAANGTEEARPAWLVAGSPSRLRLDMWFPDVLAGGERFSLAAEHHGGQHYSPRNSFNRGESRYHALVARDRAKEQLAIGAGIAFLVISDLHAIPRENNGWLAHIATSLERRLPWVCDQAYIDRRASLYSAGLTSLLPAYVSPGLVHLRRLCEERNYEILSTDIVGKRFRLRCPAHGEWTASLNNLLPGTSSERPGTGCPRCAAIKRGINRRLIGAELAVRAHAAGWSPEFAPNDYEGSHTRLPWKCQRCHSVVRLRPAALSPHRCAGARPPSKRHQALEIAKDPNWDRNVASLARVVGIKRDVARRYLREAGLISKARRIPWTRSDDRILLNAYSTGGAVRAQLRLAGNRTLASIRNRATSRRIRFGGRNSKAPWKPVDGSDGEGA